MSYIIKYLSNNKVIMEVKTVLTIEQYNRIKYEKDLKITLDKMI